MSRDSKAKEPESGVVFKRKITSLVFQGGGAKGIAYVGALLELFRASGSINFEEDIERIAGTSAGAIIAVLLCVGYSIEEIQNLLQTTPFVRFLDESGSNTRDTVLAAKSGSGVSSSFSGTTVGTTIAHRLINCFGIYEGEFFRQWVEARILEKISNNPYLTFAELHELRLRNPRVFKDLFVIGFNVNTGLAETFSYEDTPNLIIADAVRISMSLPFVFKPHCLHYKVIPRPGARPQRDPDGYMHFYIDGGITDNYPIKVFNFERFRDAKTATPNAEVFNDAVLGFRLVQQTQKDYLEGLTKAPEKKTDSLLPYVQAVLTGVYRKQQSDHVRGQDRVRTVYIDTKDVGTLDFDISKEQGQKLVESGKEAVQYYFDRRWREEMMATHVATPPIPPAVSKSADGAVTPAVSTKVEYPLPTSISNHYRRSVLHYKAGDYKATVEDCKAIMSKTPADSAYHRDAKFILAAVEKLDAAREKHNYVATLFAPATKPPEIISAYCEEETDASEQGLGILRTI